MRSVVLNIDLLKIVFHPSQESNFDMFTKSEMENERTHNTPIQGQGRVKEPHSKWSKTLSIRLGTHSQGAKYYQKGYFWKVLTV